MKMGSYNIEYWDEMLQEALREFLAAKEDPFVTWIREVREGLPPAEAGPTSAIDDP
jgi:hypothetical protein